MEKLKCPECKQETGSLFFTKEFPTGLCKTCKDDNRTRASPFAVHTFPQDGIFLEHVSPQGHRFMSKGEMRDYERKTGTIIGMLH